MFTEIKRWPNIAKAPMQLGLQYSKGKYLLYSIGERGVPGSRFPDIVRVQHYNNIHQCPGTIVWQVLMAVCAVPIITPQYSRGVGVEESL